MEDMVIGLVTTSFDKGGLEQIIFSLYEAYRKAGVEAYILCQKQQPGTYFVSRLHSAGDICIYGESFGTFISFCYQKRITHLHYHYNTSFMEEAHKCGIQTFYTIHNAYSWFDDDTIRAYGEKLNICDRLIAVSSFAKNYFCSRTGTKPECVDVVPNGIDLEEIGQSMPLPERLTRSGLNLDANDVVFAQCAAYSALKHPMGLIGVMERVLKNYSNAKLLLVGNVLEEGYYNELIRAWSESPAKDNIIFVDFIDHKYMGEFLRETVDVSVLASLQEGFGNIILEAIACKTPMILTKVGYATDIQAPGVILVNTPYQDLRKLTMPELWELETKKECNNTEELANAFIYALENLDQLKKLTKFWDTQTKNFSAEHMASSYLEVFNNCSDRGSYDRCDITNLCTLYENRIQNIQVQLSEAEQKKQRLSEALDQEKEEKTRISADLEARTDELERSEEREKQLQEEMQRISAELEVKTNELERSEEREKCLQKELDSRKHLYDDLYAYSVRRDAELDGIKNSRSYKFFLKFIKAPLHIGYRIFAKLLRILTYLFTFNSRELAREFYIPFMRLKTKTWGRAEYKKLMDELQLDIDGKRVIVMPPTLDWHMRLFQRPQQLAVSYAKKENTTVLYMTANLQHDRVPAVERISDGLWLIYCGYTKEMVELLSKARQVVMSMSWTINAPYVDQIQPDKLVYEYIDELEIFDKYDEKMITDHEWLMSRANVTVCTATKLYSKALGKATNPILSPNAGDYAFFAKTAENEINPIIRDKVKDYQCVIGYYGALAEWFDYDLVKEVARSHSDWLFVLIGMNYDGTLDKSGIGAFKNIIYVPPQAYQDLPSFLTAFDVATIPFVINEITLSTSPVKLFEYMAGGKPILTSKMPECLKYESVRTYGDADDFCRIVEEYMAMKSDDPYWDVLKREALENTWDARTDQILEAVDVSAGHKSASA